MMRILTYIIEFYKQYRWNINSLILVYMFSYLLDYLMFDILPFDTSPREELLKVFFLIFLYLGTCSVKNLSGLLLKYHLLLIILSPILFVSVRVLDNQLFILSNNHFSDYPRFIKSIEDSWKYDLEVKHSLKYDIKYCQDNNCQSLIHTLNVYQQYYDKLEKRKDLQLYIKKEISKQIDNKIFTKLKNNSSVSEQKNLPLLFKDMKYE